MAKKSGKQNDAQVKRLTTTVETLRARLEKAKAATAKWKAQAKRLEAETSKQAKQIRKLQKMHTKSMESVSRPADAGADASTAEPVPDESWTVTRLRASAREAGVVGHSRMTKAALLEALTQRSAPRA